MNTQTQEALESQEQEPYGYWVEYGEEKDFDMAFRYPDKDDYYPSDIKSVTKLYTNSAPSWQGLSDDEIFSLCTYIDHDLLEEAFYRGARAAEQELKTKNGFSDVKEKNT